MNDLNHLDDTTALVVLQTWLEDINHEAASRKRKRGDEDDPDADLQLVLTKNEVYSRIASIADRAVGRITAGEDVAEDDHRDAPNDDPTNDDHPSAEASQAQPGTNALPICACCHENFTSDELAECRCEH